ncbi:MAG: hypothetical protein NUV57_00290 [archaeon]|nr:hypothetical protein [archaeon]
MKEKGFTLFTALIAFILIVLSLLLVQSMISTERNTSDIISAISGQEEIQAIADLARADALQVFNYGIRYSVEDFSIRDDNPPSGIPDEVYVTFLDEEILWDDLKKEFVADRFGVGEDGKNKFALRAARHLNFILEKTPDARGFIIDLEQTDRIAMETTLQKGFNEQVKGGNIENFFEVIGCDSGTFSDCIGTFYITMDLSPDIMDDLEYEKFPLVKVQNVQSGKTLKEAILPRGRFRIYVPLRLFKALAAAKQIGNIVKDTTPEEGALNTAVRNAISSTGIDQVNSVESDPEYGGFKLYDWEVKVVKPNAANIEGTPILPTVEWYEIVLYFEETNPKYMVSETTDNAHIYGVSLKKFVH